MRKKNVFRTREQPEPEQVPLVERLVPELLLALAVGDELQKLEKKK